MVFFLFEWLAGGGAAGLGIWEIVGKRQEWQDQEVWCQLLATF
jgi:hypothetical protein